MTTTLVYITKPTYWNIWSKIRVISGRLWIHIILSQYQPTTSLRPQYISRIIMIYSASRRADNNHTHAAHIVICNLYVLYIYIYILKKHIHAPSTLLALIIKDILRWHSTGRHPKMYIPFNGIPFCPMSLPFGPGYEISVCHDYF